MGLFGFDAPAKKKRRQLTPAEKVFAWENFPHKCHVCGKRVSKLSEAEWDHVRPHAKGGATNLANVKITHRLCNRLKGKKSLHETKRHLGLAPKPNRKKAAPRKKRDDDPFGFGNFSLF